MVALPKQETSHHISRLYNRQTVLLGVQVRRKSERWFSCRILDMSLVGFRLTSFAKLQRGMEVWIMFPGFEGRRAEVIWTANHEAGCRLDQPLHPAIFDHIVRMSDPAAERG